MPYVGNDYKIAASSDINCGYITVTDISTYPIVGLGNATWATSGRALFWSIDNFTSVTGGDLSNPGSATAIAQWNISAINNNTYTIKSYLVPLYDITEVRAFAANSICLYGGLFYQNTSGGVINTFGIAFSIADWTELSTSDHASFINALGDGTVNAYGYDETDCVLSCSNYTIVKSECGSWIISDNSGVSGNKTIDILTYAGVVIGTPIYTLLEGSSITIDDTALETDGIYFFRITQGSTLLYFLIYEFCSLRICIDVLLKALLCREQDPCCEQCDAEQVETFRIYREELNKLMALYYQLIGKINIATYAYLGDYTLAQTRLDMVSDVNDLITKITAIVSRCGDCDGAQATTPSVCVDC